MPATARVMGKIVDQVAERKTTFSADVTAFDSFVPEFGWELLTRLAELGSAQGGPPQVAEVLRTKYLAMRTATIVDLPSGFLLHKMRGGGTGQSATSWDNTWAMRGLMVALWSVATNKPAAEFYDHNTVHNTGDDNIWGTDSDLDPDRLAEIAKTLFGTV